MHNCSITDAIKPTLERIGKGIKFPHKNDGSIFRNTKGLLPEKPLGYYNEFVNPTPGIKHAVLQRVIIGKKGEVFYSPDHYESFIKIK